MDHPLTTGSEEEDGSSANCLSPPLDATAAAEALRAPDVAKSGTEVAAIPLMTTTVTADHVSSYNKNVEEKEEADIRQRSQPVWNCSSAAAAASKEAEYT